MRKMLGGGMRQIGLLAAAADYAVEQHWSLLERDHANAKKFAEAVSKNPFFEIDLSSVFTNIVLFDVKSGNAESALQMFADAGIGMVPFGPKTIRATFHFQITDEDMATVLNVVDGF